jgi:hypothetical protein
MQKILITFLFFHTFVFAKTIYPVATLQASGLVADMVVDAGVLYVATDAGVVDVIDLRTQRKVSQIAFEPMVTARGLVVPRRVHSVDRYKGKTLLVTSSISMYREVWIDDGRHLKKIIDASQHLMPKDAYFCATGKVVLGSFGSDITLYETQEGYKRYERHISESTMGGMTLSHDKTQMIVADESGIAQRIEIATAKVLEQFQGEHVDNIYSVAYANHTLLTAGQDRRVGVYLANRSYHLKSDFLVYCVGISPSGKLGVYSSGTQNHLQLFNTQEGKKTHTLVGHQSSPNRIFFVSEKTLISTGDEYSIYFWVLPSP